MIQYECPHCFVEKMVTIAMVQNGMVTALKSLPIGECRQLGHTEPIVECWCPRCGILFHHSTVAP